MSSSDDDRYAPSGHRPTNQNTPSPECRASEMQYESRAVSLFALRSLSRPRYSRLVAHGSRLAARGSRLAARGSRLEYRTRFLAAPPAGILEQKRDCSQSTLLAARGSRLAARRSRLAARGSRLEYRTRFLAAPPAGILEQKRDCSQSTPKIPEHLRICQCCSSNEVENEVHFLFSCNRYDSIRKSLMDDIISKYSDFDS